MAIECTHMDGGGGPEMQTMLPYFLEFIYLLMLQSVGLKKGWLMIFQQDLCPALSSNEERVFKAFELNF